MSYAQYANRFATESDNIETNVQNLQNEAISRGQDVLRQRLFEDNRAFAQAEELRAKLQGLGVMGMQGKDFLATKMAKSTEPPAPPKPAPKAENFQHLQADEETEVPEINRVSEPENPLGMGVKPVPASEGAQVERFGLREAKDAWEKGKGMAGDAVGPVLAGFGVGDDMANQLGASKGTAFGIGAGVGAVEGVAAIVAPEFTPFIMAGDLLADGLTDLFAHHHGKAPAAPKVHMAQNTAFRSGNIPLPVMTTGAAK